MVLSALNPPAGSAAARKLNAVLQARAKGRKVEPLTPDEEQRWFSYDAFLDLLGLVNINLEDSGGLYALHCHMNHSCEPNVQVSLPRARELPQAGVSLCSGASPVQSSRGGAALRDRPRAGREREQALTERRCATCRGSGPRRRRCQRRCRARTRPACAARTG